MATNSVYSQLVIEVPQSARTYNDLASIGPLDAKTKRFVKLGVAAGLASESAVKYQVRKALHEGVTCDELRHAVTLALIMAGPSAVRVLKWTEEIISCNSTVPVSRFERLLAEGFGKKTHEQCIESGMRGI